MIITLASFKGGVGKTTSAIHLSCFLSGYGSTLLIDGDLNRSAMDWAQAGELPCKVVDENDAADLLPQFDHVVIDTPARPSEAGLATLAANCDLLIIPTTPDAMSLRALLKTLDMLANLGANFKILLTIIPPKPSIDGDEAYSQLISAGLPIFRRGIREFRVYSKAALQGIPVHQVRDKKAKIAWSDYVRVGQEILA